MLMVEGRYDPDRLVSAVIADGMSGEEFACYMMISSLIVSHGGAVPERETRAKLQSMFHLRAPRVGAIVTRLLDIGRLSIEHGWMSAELPMPVARSASSRVAPSAAPPSVPAKPPISPHSKPKCAPPKEKTNGHALDLFPETLPMPPAPVRSPDPIPIPPKPPAEPPKMPVSPDAIRDHFRPEFERWYEGYPNKKAREYALQAFVKARKKATLEELIAGRDRYVAAMSGEDKKMICHPSTWLNQGRWTDQYDEQAQERAWV